MIENNGNQTEINMKVDLADLRDIYFGEREQVYFFGPETKVESFFMVTALILFPFHTWYFVHLKEGGGAFIIGFSILIALIANFWSSAKPIIRWKKSINEFLKTAVAVKDLRFIYNETFVLHRQDEQITKINWSQITRATITGRYINLVASTEILLPKNSMTASEYELLSEKILEKVQEVNKV